MGKRIKAAPDQRASKRIRETESRKPHTTIGERNSHPIAKLSLPMLQDALPRERLFAWLDAQATHKLLWISGPPGSGKTTLIASYLERSARSVLWYRADNSDSELPTVFYNLREAALMIAPQAALALPLLTPEYLLDVAVFSRNFFRTLFGLFDGAAALVIDNYQEAGNDALDAVMRIAIAESPSSSRIMVISRNDPPATLAALQVKSMLATLNWEQLRLTWEEAQALAARARVTDPVFVRSQYALCDGWVAGLVLLLEHAKQTTVGTDALSAKTHATLFQYFSSELFSLVPIATQHLLLSTALLPSFTLAQAAAFDESQKVEEVIGWLYRRSFFIERRDESVPTYRYHDLFRAFLLECGKAMFSPAQRRDLLRKAAQVAEHDEQQEVALVLVMEAETWQEATRLILTLAPSVLQQGRNTTLDRWIDALPLKVIDQVAWLRYWQGISRLPYDPRHGRSVLEQSYAQFDAQSDFIGCVSACAGILQSFLLEWGELKPLDRWLEVFQSLLNNAQGRISADMEAQLLPCLASTVFRCSNHEFVQSCVERALTLVEQMSDPAQQVALATFPLQHLFCTGHWTRGAHLLQLLERNLDRSLLPPLHRIQLSAYKIIWCAFCPGQFSRATGEAELKQFIDLTTSTGIHVMDSLGHGMGIYFALLHNDLPLADRLLAQMKAPHHRQAIGYDGHRAALLADISLARGDANTAEQHARLSMKTSEVIGTTMGIVGTRIVLCQVHLVREEFDAALEEAEASIVAAQALGLFGFWHAGLLLKAYSLLQSGRDKLGLESLYEGLGLGRSTGQTITCPWSLPKITAYLYAIALAHGIETDYVRNLIRLLGIQPPSTDIAVWPWPLRIYTLGRFAVLRDDEPLKFANKAQKKPLELLRILISLGGRAVAIGDIMHSAWRGEGASARANFDVAVMRLRKLLGRQDALVLTDGKLTLNDQLCWVDCWAFERAITQLDKVKDADIDAQVLDLYRGAFLETEHGTPLIASMRDRLAAKFQRVVLRVGKEQERVRRWDVAAHLYRRGLEQDRVAEEFYRRLMHCESQLGHRAEAIKIYRRCRDMLSINLHVKPSGETETLYRQLLAD